MKVVIAIIFNDVGNFLITQRSSDDSYPEFWEFPGGKVEANETLLEALQREIQEEVGLTILSSEFLTALSYQGDTRRVDLKVYIITRFQGTAECKEAQKNLCWVPLQDLKNYSFPPANQAILIALEQWLSLSRYQYRVPLKRS